jgi:hypothetical protein
LVVFDAVGVDIALFDLIAADDWHPQASPSFLAKVVFPDPGWPVMMMMHFGFLIMFLGAQGWPSVAAALDQLSTWGLSLP